jgi:hypothetical protein
MQRFPRTQTSIPTAGVLVLAAILLNAACLAAHQRDPDYAREAKNNLLRVAALRALTNFVRSDDLFDLQRSRVAAAIRSDPEAHRKQHDDLVRTMLENLADQRLESKLEGIIRKLDPDGEHYLDVWLWENARSPADGRVHSPFQKARRRVGDDLKKGDGTSNFDTETSGE